MPIESIISSCLESKSNAIIDHVLRDCDLVGRFLQADKNSILSAESNQVYLQRLMALENKPLFQHVAVRCICSLLDANPHFNYRESLLDATVRNISSTNDAIRFWCIFSVHHFSL
ncbi:hypothetical protein PHAVU_L001640 [Phaseolus vulgaris]|uniref:Uncharacterized protein n=2 Tax=Phaseolus vulgaris TaxID=3885 RepID=A0ACC3P0A1_PHAVU|nr:hypothetical protein PHAVU_011G075100g [Phaseolus vulgaris]ESW04201.1 hypothetical protein PHAVU_011G075100g [Phaseolus vulgaris]